MGCTNPNPKPRAAPLGSDPQAQNSAVKAASAGEAPPQVPKITAEEAQKRRAELRKNLQQGKCNPPKIRVPKIQAIETE